MKKFYSTNFNAKKSLSGTDDIFNVILNFYQDIIGKTVETNIDRKDYLYKI